MLEHKGLYWSKVPGTQGAKTVEPDDEYVLPLGKARLVIAADAAQVQSGSAALVVTYGMGVYWAASASKDFRGRVTVLDLRTLNPLDWEAVQSEAERHGRVLIVTEEPLTNSFAESLAGRISERCFASLDAPVMTLGAADLPAVPLNVDLERAILPSSEKIAAKLKLLLEY
jgi:2-oxoisovalerate dehydrogenase E1 component